MTDTNHANTYHTPKTFPLTEKALRELTKKYPTPFHIYDEKLIRENFRRLREAFAWAPDFREHFAVKATPNPYIVELLAKDGAGTDCSSIAELYISEAAGVTGEKIMLTSNDTPAKEFRKALELGAIINLDDITHIEYIERNAGLPEVVSFRYNPADIMNDGNDIIGRPAEAKYGLTREQIFDAYKICLDKGIKRFGLHTMIASNERKASTFVYTARIMFELAAQIKDKLGIKFEFINLGGGVGIPYRPDESPVDLKAVGEGIKNLYHEILVPVGLGDIRLAMESGRAITGSAGWLVSTVLHKKDTYKNYVGLDSCMSDLMRPALYGAYHHITVVGKENMPCTETYDVTGSLCENNDKFAIDRNLPPIDIGDLLIIHDTGAHGHAMGFNYNGKLRSAELLIRENGEVEMIRRAETLNDYFATLNFPNGRIKLNA
ncbi:MAG: diaminopimelate decarboxylase [Selenomonadaceae bacterium]|nr:diaminopimelate decarboxylase [Selenomonadaceae bacterium]